MTAVPVVPGCKFDGLTFKDWMVNKSTDNENQDHDEGKNIEQPTAILSIDYISRKIVNDVVKANAMFKKITEIKGLHLPEWFHEIQSSLYIVIIIYFYI